MPVRPSKASGFQATGFGRIPVGRYAKSGVRKHPRHKKRSKLGRRGKGRIKQGRQGR